MDPEWLLAKRAEGSFHCYIRSDTFVLSKKAKIRKGGLKVFMGQAIEYQKLITEIVYINLPGPEEPGPGLSGVEILHGFLAELYRAPNPEVKNYIDFVCGEWNVHYREKQD